MMKNFHLSPVFQYFCGIFVILGALKTSHSMELSSNSYEEDTPMAAHQHENFWEVQNLELTFSSDSQIAGPIILIPRETGTAENSLLLDSLLKADDFREKITSKNCERLLDRVFEALCHQFEINNKKLKQILAEDVSLQKLKTKALLTKDTHTPNSFQSIMKDYAETLIKTFHIHSNYAIGHQHSDTSQLFHFKNHPIHIAKADFSWVESLNVYIPRKKGEESYYDNYFFLKNKNPIKRMEQLTTGEDREISSSDTLCLKLTNIHLNAKLTPEFIFDSVK